MSVLEIYTFPANRTFYLNTESTKIYTYPNRRPRNPCGDVVGAWLAMKAWVAVKAWTAETVDGGDTKCRQKSYVRNHGEIIIKSLSKLCQESLENHVLNWDDCF